MNRYQVICKVKNGTKTLIETAENPQEAATEVKRRLKASLPIFTPGYILGIKHLNGDGRFIA